MLFSILKLLLLYIKRIIEPNFIIICKCYKHPLKQAVDTLSFCSKATRLGGDGTLVCGRTPRPRRQVAAQHPTWSHGPGPVRGAQRPACHAPQPLCAAVPQSADATHPHKNILRWFYHISLREFHENNPWPQPSCGSLGIESLLFTEEVVQLAPSDFDFSALWDSPAAESESSRGEGQYLPRLRPGYSQQTGSESLLQANEFKYLRVWSCWNNTSKSQLS